MKHLNTTTCKFLSLALIAFAFASVVRAQDETCAVKIDLIESDTKSRISNANVKIINYDKRTIHYESPLDSTVFENLNSGRLSISITLDQERNLLHNAILKCPKSSSSESEPINIRVVIEKRSDKENGERVPTRVVGGLDDNSNRATRIGHPSVNSGGIKLGKPNYPAAARVVRASGSVKVSVVIDTEGNVISALAVSGHPLLLRASESAAASSVFKVTRLAGQPVEVAGIIVYNFTP